MFSIVIPTWNNLAHLQLVLRSIREHSREAHQIIVHVNDGRDGTREWVRAQGIAHTASDDNIGICYAMNEAAMLARHEHLVYMNDDMYCLPGWDTALQRRVPARQAVHVVVHVDEVLVPRQHRRLVHRVADADVVVGGGV
ncbi:MAG: glycosyltransferase family 2 protein, partial [Burkholderiaceae bacterium]